MLALFRKFIRRSLLKRFAADSKAAAAVEFAMIAAPLVFMMCACVEVGMIFLVSTTLDNATDMASRGIRTGLTTNGNTSVAQFKQTICTDMGWLSGSCPTSLSVEVQTYNSFPLAAADAATNQVSNGKLNTSLPFAMGTGSQIQMVRVFYDWPLFTPLMNSSFSALSNGDALLTYQVVFRNEPF